MAEKILMIALSPTMEEGKITDWKVKEGQTVKSGDILCEVETDKAVMEYESPVAGTILKIVLEAGRSAKIGDLIAVAGKAGENVDAILKESPGGEPPSPKAEARKAGGSEKPGKAAAEAKPAETGPAASAREPAEAATRESTPEAVKPEPASPAVPGYGGYPRSSPLARRLAAEKGLDVRSIPGTGPEGRVVRRDVLRAAEAPEGFRQAARGASPASPGPAPAAAPYPRPVLRDEDVPVSGMRAAIAKRLAESMYSAPHYFLRVSAGMDNLMDARTRINDELKGKLSLNAFFMKFAAEAIKRHPRINSTWKGTVIRMNGSVDIGLAVALPDGLITPVVRDCGNKGVAEIDRELAVLVEKARSGALKPEEYSGATFSISNLGTSGIEEFTAIINPPGSAILALGETRREPVVTGEDEVAIRRMMRMTLSCDHRTIDGAVGAAFLSDLRLMIEDPVRALV